MLVGYLGAGVGGEDAHLEPDAPGRVEERLRGVREPASAHEAEPLERLLDPREGKPDAAAGVAPLDEAAQLPLVHIRHGPVGGLPDRKSVV